MGSVFGKKVVPIPMQFLIRKLESCQLPDEHEKVLQVLEEIDIQLASDPKTIEIKMKQLKDLDGIRIIIKLVKKIVSDKSAVIILLQMLDSIKGDVPLMMDFIQYGGLDVLTKAGELYAKDNYLSVMIPRLSRVILAAGASSSIKEIEEEAIGLKLCKCCQETIAKSKMKIGSVGLLQVPKSSDRINRVLRFMENYLPRVDVQIAGLEAVINFARNADSASSTLSETNVIDVVTDCIKHHSQQVSIVWRGCMALGILARYHSEIAVDITLTNIHEHMMDHFDKLSKHPLAQQQIIWLLAALTVWPRSYKLIHKSRKSLDFIKRIINKADGKDRNPTIKSPSKQEIVVILDDDVPGNTDLTDEMGPEVTYLIPLEVRRFYRETNGMTYKAKKTEKEKKTLAPIRTRRNFDELPKYGTIEQTLFGKGEKGLIDDEPIEKESEKEANLRPLSGKKDPTETRVPKPDWEKALDTPLARTGALKKKKKVAVVQNERR